jgi:hypothetical protein
MKILYAIMGEPLSIGWDHLIVTESPEFIVVTVTGASGLNAQSRVMLSEKSLSPYEFRL